MLNFIWASPYQAGLFILQVLVMLGFTSHAGASTDFFGRLSASIPYAFVITSAQSQKLTPTFQQRISINLHLPSTPPLGDLGGLPLLPLINVQYIACNSYHYKITDGHHVNIYTNIILQFFRFH